MKKITSQQKKLLMKQAHALNPVLMIGRHGLTPAVHSEIEVALTAHALIKIRISGYDRAQREDFLQQIAQHHQAQLVHQIGLIAIFYRPEEA